jgi:putative membrane-bound dehydrogenase-like protein
MNCGHIMRTNYLTAVAIIVFEILPCFVVVRRATPQSDAPRYARTQPEEADRETERGENFQIHAGWQPLFNGRNLDGWYTFLEHHGRNADPDHIIAIENGVIHLYRDSKDGNRVVQGYIATEEEYGNYHLRLQYRWGEKKFEPRAALPRDAGLYYHLIGDDAVWPAGLQCQIQEGNTGDLLALFGLQMNSWVSKETKDQESRRTFRDERRGGVPVVFGGSGIAYQTRSVMNELAGWNTLEVIARHNSITHILNGKTVNRGEDARKVDATDPTRSVPVTKGRIALEIEAAEIEYRNIEIKQLEAEPPAETRAAEQTPRKEALDVRVGASAVNLHSNEKMVIGGGIEPHYAAEQEGQLRAVALVIERPGQAKVAIVACDVLFVPRELADAAVAEIEKKTGIPADHLLINATHTHHAPSTARVHGYDAVPEFCDELRRGIVRAVDEANSRLKVGDAQLFFYLGSEDAIGSNSRQLLEDGSITWTAQQEPGEKARPTGPFDPQLPVFDFRNAEGKSRALLFNHSTHTIGTRSGRDARSPAFYGLAAQELEAKLGGVVTFLEGASGSTHNVAPRVPVDECIKLLLADIQEARAKASPRQIRNLEGIRRPFKFRVRKFNEAEEDAKVANYTRKYMPQASERCREVFANMRRQLRDRQGAQQETWIQAIAIGDIAVVGVPAEYFTALGIDIKQRSPFEHTYIAELANDWIGYLPDREGHRLGGYQTWMGLHSYAEEGTGERMADEVVQLLNELSAKLKGQSKTHEPKSAASPPTAHEDKQANTRAARSPVAEQASFRFADPTLRVDLVASEPDVVSPVAVAWDADGRMFVVEMDGYPTTEGAGRIRRLEDRNGDGHYDNAVTFCDRLNFPTSVMPYRAGVLVTDAPDILYLEDIDGDGRADVRQVEWTGFGTGSQQLRANSLHWGLDNWIYVANGRCDGDVRCPGSPSGGVISIRARDFRFNPISHEGQAILGQSQFGQAHDAWGHRFLSWNTIPVRHVMLEEPDVSGYPAAAAEAVVNVSDPSDSGRVYPIASPPRQFNKEQALYYNAMCGLTIFAGDALGKPYDGNAFICESLTGLVTRRQLERAGPTFVARRSANEKNREFLASTDNWFHPVNLATGPDGALYVVDFYREFVEHPIYVADEKVRAEVNWRSGAGLGRIWRIRRSNTKFPADHRPALSRASNVELVELLNHPVAWWRNTAQQLLVERQDRTIVPQLRSMLAKSLSPLARLHAMYVLDGLDANKAPRAPRDSSAARNSDALDMSSLRRALGDSDPHIRQHAVRLVAQRIDREDEAEPLWDKLIHTADDADSSVCFQLALALGRHNDSRAARALVMSLSRDATPTMRLAILCGAGQNPWPFMRELLENAEVARRNTTLLEQLSEQFALRADEKGLVDCLEWLTAEPERQHNAGDLATLAGISRGLFARGRTLLSPSSVEIPRRLANRLRESVSNATTLAKDTSHTAEERTWATVIAASGNPADIEPLVRDLVDPSQPQSVQLAAVWAAAQANLPRIWQNLFGHWSGHTTSTRTVMLVQALRSPAGTAALIDALEADRLSPQELSASTREVLSQLHDESLRRRVQPILASTLPTDRTEVLARYSDVANRHGDVVRGAAVFKQNCQTCHAIQGVGQKVGPDLTSVASRRTDLLLADILDPSRQVSPDYVSYLLVTKDGHCLSGLIAAETSESVTLRREDGQQDTIARSNIEQLRASGKSIMPDGLEQKLSPDQLTDLLEFLHNPDVHQLN